MGTLVGDGNRCQMRQRPIDPPGIDPRSRQQSVPPLIGLAGIIAAGTTRDKCW